MPVVTDKSEVMTHKVNTKHFSPAQSKRSNVKKAGECNEYKQMWRIFSFIFANLFCTELWSSVKLGAKGKLGR